MRVEKAGTPETHTRTHACTHARTHRLGAAIKYHENRDSYSRSEACSLSPGCSSLTLCCCARDIDSMTQACSGAQLDSTCIKSIICCCITRTTERRRWRHNSWRRDDSRTWLPMVSRTRCSERRQLHAKQTETKNNEEDSNYLTGYAEGIGFLQLLILYRSEQRTM